jgi:glycerol-3-phosphate dehydrogenase subunit B
VIRDGGRYDAVVIGAGVAGLTAATRLAQRGASVCVLARGVGCTHLAPATIDVLAEGDLDEFIAARADHPYAAVGVAGVQEALAWLRTCFDESAYAYVGHNGHDHLLPGPLGVPRRSTLVPVTMAAGDLGDAAPMCIVAIAELRDFPAGLCAANLATRGHEARAVTVEAQSGRVEANAVTLARRFDDAAFRAQFAARLQPLLRDGERVGMPAVLGLRDPYGAWTDLQDRLGHRVFEIPTLPPSAPGVRLYEALRSALRAAGGTLALGARVVGAEKFMRVLAEVSGHRRSYLGTSVVLATGGLASGGLELSPDGELRETALRIGTVGEPTFDPDPFAPQPIARAGVKCKPGSLNFVGDFWIAGAALPGADARREGCGEGVALSTGHRVAELIGA